MTELTYNFAGKTAFVTGGSGEATVRAFAQAGANVAVVDRDADAAKALADELTAKGQKVISIACDVSDEDQVATAVRKTVEVLGSLDMAFNNAGIMLPPVDSADETEEAFDRIVAVNLKGVWASMKHELKQMREQGSGAIVNVPPSADWSAATAAAPTTPPSTASSEPRSPSPSSTGSTACAATPSAREPSRPRWSPGWPTAASSTATRPPPACRWAASVAPTRSPPRSLWLYSEAASYVTGAALPVDAGHTAQ